MLDQAIKTVVIFAGLVAGVVLIGLVIRIVIKNGRITRNDLIMSVVALVFITFSHWGYISIGDWIKFSKAVSSLDKAVASITFLEGKLKKTVDSLGVRLQELGGEPNRFKETPKGYTPG